MDQGRLANMRRLAAEPPDLSQSEGQPLGSYRLKAFEISNEC